MARPLPVSSPTQMLEDFRREIDDLFNRFAGPGRHGREPMAVVPPLESLVDRDEFVLRVDLPGIDPKDVEVIVNDDLLTVRGSREHHSAEEDKDFVHCEIAHGNFQRSVTLPRGIRPEDIKALYHNGILELRMPAPKGLAGHKVPIRVQAAEPTDGEARQQRPAGS